MDCHFPILGKTAICACTLPTIIDAYTKSVEIPKKKGVRFFLCPVGLIGSGKTTVLKPLAKKLGLVRISGDEIRKMLKDGGFGYEGDENIAFAAGEYFIGKGYGIAIDADCVRSDKREKIEKLAKKLSMPIIWVHINPPEKFILNKLKNYPHTWLFKDAKQAIANYKARKPLHKKLNFDFAYTFDTSRPNLKRQIKEAADIIKGLWI